MTQQFAGHDPSQFQDPNKKEDFTGRCIRARFFVTEFDPPKVAALLNFLPNDESMDIEKLVLSVSKPDKFFPAHEDGSLCDPSSDDEELSQGRYLKALKSSNFPDKNTNWYLFMSSLVNCSNVNISDIKPNIDYMEGWELSIVWQERPPMESMSKKPGEERKFYFPSVEQVVSKGESSSGDTSKRKSRSKKDTQKENEALDQASSAAADESGSESREELQLNVVDLLSDGKPMSLRILRLKLIKANKDNPALKKLANSDEFYADPEAPWVLDDGKISLE